MSRMDMNRPALPPEEYFVVYLLLDIGLSIRGLLKREGNERDLRESQELMATLTSPMLEDWADVTGRYDLWCKMVKALEEVQKGWAAKAPSSAAALNSGLKSPISGI